MDLHTRGSMYVCEGIMFVDIDIYVIWIQCITTRTNQNTLHRTNRLKPHLRIHTTTRTSDIGSNELMQDAIILVRHMRAEHVSCKHDLVEGARHVEDLEQPHFVSALLRFPGLALGVSQAMVRVQVAIAHCPQDTPRRKELRHVHVGF